MADAQELSTYLIYVSPTEFKGELEHLKEFITQNKLVNTWWNYIPFIFVITSMASSKELKDAFSKFTGNNTDLLVAKIDPFKTTGFAPEGAWQAFNTDIRKVIDPEFPVDFAIK